MLTIYHLEQSRSERIIWLAEELGIKYKVETFPRTPSRQASPDYKALHPLGRAPIIRDGALTLVESGAIIEYILGRYGKGKLVPKKKTPEHAQFLQWLHFAEGTLLQHLLAVYFIDMAKPPDAPQAPIRGGIVQRLGEDLAYIDATLAKQPYFAGKKFTGADINMAYGLNFAANFPQSELPAYPHIAAYNARITERPAYKKAKSFG